MTREKYGLHIGDDFSASGGGIQQQNLLLRAFSLNIDLPKTSRSSDCFVIGKFQYTQLL